jgi:GDP-mannose pyrophosphatase NudK
MIEKVKVLQTDILSDNEYPLKKIRYEYYKPGGSRHEQSREVYDRGDAATILLYNAKKKTVIVTRQFRLPVFINGGDSGFLIEACAGMLDDDTPEEGIIRETEEETGYKIQDVKKLFHAYMSPGAVTELLHFFIAEYNPLMKVSDGGGAKGEEENIDVIELNIDEAIEKIKSGEIIDGKTIMLLQYVKLHNIL